MCSCLLSCITDLPIARPWRQRSHPGLRKRAHRHHQLQITGKNSSELALGSTQMQLYECHRSLTAETPPHPHRTAVRTQGTPVARKQDGCVSPEANPLLCSRSRDPSAQTQRCPPRPAGIESAHRRPTYHPNGTAQLPAPRAAPRASEERRGGVERGETRRGAFPPAALGERRPDGAPT